MKQTKIHLFYLVLLFAILATLISQAYAVDESGQVNIQDVPQRLGNALGISDPGTAGFVGGLLASAILMFTFILPVALYSKSFLPSMLVGFLLMGTCIGLGWLPYWFLLIIVMLVALMFAGNMRDWITGKGR